MNLGLEISFDTTTDGYIIQLPGFVQLNILKHAKLRLEKVLFVNPRKISFSALLDTGAHEFESIECLKYLRELLSIKPRVEHCRVFVLVAPESYVQAEFKSGTEASFNQRAHLYLAKKQSP